MSIVRMSLLAVLMSAIMITGFAVAQEEKMPEGMPEMGPPKEIQDAGYLIGDWDVDMKTKWDPADTSWQSMKATAKYEWVAGGGAIMMTFQSEFMGMPFIGTMLMCYDRETKMWQSTWTDNMSSRISYMEGTKKDGKMVMTGEDKYQGMTYFGRITVANETPTSFDWTMENSFDGGNTWTTSGIAKYTKSK